MKNWLIFISVFIVSLSLVISILVLWKAEAPFRSIEEQAEQLALDAKALAIVSESYTYNGKHSYVTVFGVDEYGDKSCLCSDESRRGFHSGSVIRRWYYGKASIIGF